MEMLLLDLVKYIYENTLYKSRNSDIWLKFCKACLHSFVKKKCGYITGRVKSQVAQLSF